MKDFSQATWLNKPKESTISKDKITITTDPATDFWQRSYYGFRNDNAPGLLAKAAENFTLTVKAGFAYQNRFDQCGLLIYQDSENWFKASIEYENGDYSRLGSVVTNRGYSDWATTDIVLPPSIWYRLSRRGPDFLIEHSLDGETFMQMRVFHLACLGETTPEMGKADPPLPPAGTPEQTTVKVGPYACSPLESSFTAEFTEIRWEPCLWKAH